MKKTIINIAILISISWLISGCAVSNISTATGKPMVTNALTRKIETTLNNSKELQGTNIKAESVPTGILLSGTVATERQKYLASTIANSLVKRGTVINRITFTRLQIKKPNPIKTKK